MADTQRPDAGEPLPAGGGRRRILTAVALAPILLVLAVLIYYFIARETSDWVLVLAMALCAAAVGARLLAVFLPKRPK